MLAVHEHARPVGAHLAGGVEIAEDCAGHGIVELGVVEHDERRFAAELERHVLEGLGRLAHDDAACPGLAGERDLGDARMGDEGLPGARVALHDVEGAVGQPGLLERLGEVGGGEGRQLGRLEDHRVAAGECRGRLPAGDLDRVVPGADPGDHAEGLAPRIAERRGAEVDMLAGQRRGNSGEIVEAIRPRQDVDRDRLLDRLAGVARLGLGDLLVARAQNIRGLPEDAAALGSRRPRPRREPRPGGVDGPIDRGRVGLDDLAQDLAGRGVDGGEPLGRARLVMAAADMVGHDAHAVLRNRCASAGRRAYRRARLRPRARIVCRARVTASSSATARRSSRRSPRLSPKPGRAP